MNDQSENKPRRIRDSLPGDASFKETIEQMIRVDHAGEYGAVRIYEGQLAVLGDRAIAPVIKHMADQEREHLSTFEALAVKHRARPTAR